MLLSEFSQPENKIPCPRTIICNNCKKINLLGDILNAVDNVDDQEDYGFRGSLFNIAPTVIDDYIKKKFLNVQLENLRPKRNIDNNYQKSDKIYQINMTDEK